jgi:hypothetical protein
MKLVRFFLKGVLLAVFTFFVTEIIEILLYVLVYSFSFVGPLAEGVITSDLSNPWTYFIMLPAIALSIFFSRRTNSLKENIFEASSLKEAFFEGFGWAAIQFGILIVISLGVQGAMEQFTFYLVSLGVFMGPLMDYVFREFRDEAHKEKKGVIIAIITIILFCVGVPLSLYLYPTNGNTSSNTGTNAGMNTIGNTSGNLVNGGETALQGDWIYYNQSNLNPGLYKIKTDGTGKTKLSNNGAKSINVVGDWIYYSNGNDKLKIYKIKTDGTGESKLNDDIYISTTSVMGDWIYYVDEHGMLYKIKTDGTEKSKQSDELFDYKTNIVGDWVYYSNDNDSRKLYKIKTDGTEKAKICDDAPTCLNADGDWIYYSYSLENGSTGALYKIKNDGTGKIKLSGGYVASINVAGERIYFSSSYNEGGMMLLYKIKTDGTGKTKICNDQPTFINVVGDWIYYGNYGWGEFKIKTDGSRRGGV